MRVGDVFGSVSDKGAGLVRAHGGAKELVDRVQVHRQRIDLAADSGFDPVLIGFERGEPVHIVPDPCVIRMKDMRPVDMDHHARIRVALGVAIPAGMGARIQNGDGMARLGQLAPDHGP